MTKALILWGGWEGHTPRAAAERVADALRAAGGVVDLENSLAPLEDADRLRTYQVIVPVWTMGQLSKEQGDNLNQAVAAGVGFAGFHGGAGDAFRGNLNYEWMVGGLFVGHPYVGTYQVARTGEDSPITAGLPPVFDYHSEQYYMLVDPANRVLATTRYRHNGQDVTMPVIWTKFWGRGRVFYSALGHEAKEFEQYPAILEMTVRGIHWAAGSKI
ncbi:MAG: ThuA domain-containing protein [Candidatus Marinimicrobia bacterium]|nr:ThuA domain-containing protein [Candidatus Neomarinimicrobiota bacterium]